jgi:signal transduction histidine kinase
MKWRKTIGEFIRNGMRRGSYDPRRNPFLVFGFFWGLPIPIYTLYFGFPLAGLPREASLLPQLFAAQPWQIYFLLHPVLFAGIFGILGVFYVTKEEQVAELLQQMRDKVRELNLANRDLKQLDRMKDEFLSNITHELRTPLVTIQGYSEMLGSGRLGQLTDKQRKALDVMQRNQQRLVAMIEQLLAYGRLEEHGGQVFESAFSVRKLMRHLRQNFLPAMEKKGVRFEVIAPAEDLQVLGQEDLIEQVFVNLLGNARKFTDPGGQVLFYVDKSEYPERVALVVKDNGCGIPEDELPFIFERFRQGDGSISRQHGGAGLGLAIVKRILDAHRAPIKVESRPGEGTRIAVTLPLAAARRAGPGR